MSLPYIVKIVLSPFANFDFLLSVPTEKKSAGIAQGEPDPKDGAHGRQEHPTETWLSSSSYRVQHRTWSAAVCPQE